MGSHYSQCFATRQSIAPGDKCYAIAIRQQATYRPVALTHKGAEMSASGISHSAIYPDAYWTTVGNFIEGRYRMNGDMDIVENDENFRRLLAFTRLMLENATVTLQGENTTHDLAYDFPAYVKENCPALQRYLDAGATAELRAEEKAQVFAEMTDGWEHTDDVAFKHRVFYVDHQGNPRPLQFTLLHGKTYDTLLAGISPEHTPDVYAEKILAVLDEKKASGVYPKELLSAPRTRELAAWVGPYAVRDTMRQLGEFDSIRYYEDKLGFDEFGLQYLTGELSKAKLRKLMLPVLRDRLVVHMLESYEIKFAPKSIRYEDDKNHIGKAYAELAQQVSEVVSKSRKRARRY